MDISHDAALLSGTLSTPRPPVNPRGYAPDYGGNLLPRRSASYHQQHKIAGSGTGRNPVGGPLSRVIAIILAHHDKFDGSGYGPSKGNEIPIEARVLAVADAFDTLTSDRPYRRAVTPFEARQIIVSSAGTNFDPTVVDAFVHAFEHGEMEIPEALVV